MIFHQSSNVIGNMKENIPLSWFHKKIEFPKFNWINLPLSAMPWIYSADVPASYGIEELNNHLESEFPEGFLMRGCGFEIASFFNDKGYEVLRTGAEAVIDLCDLAAVSKSVMDLVDRGEMWGRVQELAFTQSNCRRVSKFIKHTPYGSKPRLSYLFNNAFDSSTRCFVVSSPEDIWLGVLTVSISSDNSCHTEMILRNEKAPVGVMEYLLYSVMNTYRYEGYKYFSLGEVPFVSPWEMVEINIEANFKRSTQQYLVFRIGRLIRYAFNYKGLYDFKNKFNPTWRPIYICATPKLKFRSLLDLFCETGYLELSRSELLGSIRAFSKLPSS